MFMVRLDSKFPAYFSRAMIAALLVGCLASGPATAQAPGTPDSSFGASGQAWVEGCDTSNFNPVIAQGSSEAFYLAGRRGYGPGPFERADEMFVGKFSRDGVLDTAYGEGGYAWCGFNTAFNGHTDLVAQEDGKVLLAGFRTEAGTGEGKYFVARFKTTGELDSTFGSGGIKYTSFLGYEDAGVKLLAEPGGKIVLLTFKPDNPASNPPLVGKLALVRFDSNGTLDATFGSSGLAVMPFNAAWEPMAIATQCVTSDPDECEDMYYVSGLSLASNPGNGEDFVARFRANGTLDSTFGDTQPGVSFTHIKSGLYSGIALADDWPGLILAGYRDQSGTGDDNHFLTRFDQNGSVDLTFGFLGAAYTGLGSDPYDATAVSLARSAGRLLLLGTSYDAEPGSQADEFLAAFNLDGTLESSFGVNGIAFHNNASHNELAGSGLIAQASGKFVAAHGTGGGAYIRRYLGFPATPWVYLFSDGFESGTVTNWSAIYP